MPLAAECTDTDSHDDMAICVLLYSGIKLAFTVGLLQQPVWSRLKKQICVELMLAGRVGINLLLTTF